MERESGLTRSIIGELLWISEEVIWKVKVVLVEVSLTNFILWISNEISWNVEKVLIEVTLMKLILGITNGNK